jgi:hydroxyacylglutathione hydrolase
VGGDAAVIDPQRDVDHYLQFAAEHGLRISHVILTHLHADFIAGHLELRERTGATIYLGRTASAEYPFTPLGTGDRITLGGVHLESLETPGHTPESICLLVHDAASREPAAVLTGDTLFIGDVGRPDLRAALGWTATDLGNRLYDSLARLMTLPDSSLVYPAHGAGSLCGKALSKETVSTIGEQRRVNYALQPMTRETFVDLVTTDQPEAPAYFTYDAVLNSKIRPTLSEALLKELMPLSLEDVLGLQRIGAMILDTRESGEFASAHLKDSVNIGLGGQFATWAGTLVGKDEPVVLVTTPGAEHESALRLGRIGFDNVRGYLDGGMAEASGRAARLRRGDRLSPELAAERLAGADAPLAIDIRTPAEHTRVSIPGTLHVPLSQWAHSLPQVPKGRAAIVFCAGGYRSSIAASLLRRHGVQNVSEIAGGIAAWQTVGLSVS